MRWVLILKNLSKLGFNEDGTNQEIEVDEKSLDMVDRILNIQKIRIKKMIEDNFSNFITKKTLIKI